MVNKISDYDNRQISIMKHKIIAYKEKKIKLLSLIQDLESLGNLIESAGSDWKKQFFLNWDIIEVNYAVASSEERNLNIDEKKEIDKAIQNIEKLIAEFAF